MSQGPLCPNLTQKVQKEVSQIANRNLPCVILLGGLSVNLNHLKFCNGMVEEFLLICHTIGCPISAEKTEWGNAINCVPGHSSQWTSQSTISSNRKEKQGIGVDKHCD